MTLPGGSDARKRQWHLCYGPALVRARGKTLRALALSICAAILAGVALPAATGAPGDQSDQLRTRKAELQEQSHEALLELYSIETRLERARARVAELDREKLRLERQSAALRRDLRAAQKVIKTTQKNLGARVRALYEAGDVDDPIAIIFGATSIDDAVTRLEGLEQIVGQQNAVLNRALDARTKLTHLRSNLARRLASLDSLRAQARANATGLASALAEKSSTIDRLASERDLTGRQLSRLSSRASEAANTSLEAERDHGDSANSDPAPSEGDGGNGGGSGGGGGGVTAGSQLTVSATCYCLKGTTASGLPVGPGIAATDPTVIPMGTRMSVPGYGNAVAADTGSAVKGLTIDLWVESCDQARAYGRQTITITIL